MTSRPVPWVHGKQADNCVTGHHASSRRGLFDLDRVSWARSGAERDRAPDTDAEGYDALESSFGQPFAGGVNVSAHGRRPDSTVAAPALSPVPG